MKITFTMPIDVIFIPHYFFQVIIETMVGFALGIIATVMSSVSKLKDISISA
jgi:hypothetical protein